MHGAIKFGVSAKIVRFLMHDGHGHDPGPFLYRNVTRSRRGAAPFFTSLSNVKMHECDKYHVTFRFQCNDSHKYFQTGRG